MCAYLGPGSWARVHRVKIEIESKGSGWHPEPAKTLPETLIEPLSNARHSGGEEREIAIANLSEFEHSNAAGNKKKDIVRRFTDASVHVVYDYEVSKELNPILRLSEAVQKIHTLGRAGDWVFASVRETMPYNPWYCVRQVNRFENVGSPARTSVAPGQSASTVAPLKTGQNGSSPV